MRICTTCHKAGWEQYGRKCLEGLDFWPSEAEIYWYTEGFDLATMRPVKVIPNETLERLAAFKAKYSYYLAPSWRYDVVRFANKVYAAYDALYDYDGLGIWMDADIIATAPLPPGYLESLLPNTAYIALFQREGWHSETGLWLVDCSHPMHKRFWDALIDCYESGRFKEAHEWHDCVMLDATIRSFEREGLIQAHNMSGPNSKQTHPMARHPIASYIDHLKGPARKELGRSPERVVA